MGATGRNTAGHLYGLTTLCPIRCGIATGQDRSFDWLTRESLAGLECNEASMFAKAPNTYFARFLVLSDVFYESSPAQEEHLKSPYLVYTSNFHGALDDYLIGLWMNAESEVRAVWSHCVAFDKVTNATDFVSYMKRCQLTNALLFNGSTDEPLSRQLKQLYLKQELGRFAEKHQGTDVSDEQLAAAFKEFLQRVQPSNLARPTWRAGASTINTVEVA